MNTSSNPSWQAAFGLLALRLFAAYEFLESGLEKWNGENWFAEINSQFPFPFNLLSDTVNWNLAGSIDIPLKQTAHQTAFAFVLFAQAV